MKSLKNTSPLFFLTLSLFLSMQMTRAQVVMPSTQNTGLSRNVFGLGFFAGASGGIGLSFRHHLPMQLSYQVTGGIIKLDGKMRSNVGFIVQYDLTRSDRSRFFVGGAFGYYYSGKDGNNEMTAPTRGALGIGGEWPMSGGLHFSGDLMFTFFSDGNVLPLPQVGVYYYFN
jgi:hypothetical protein